MNAQHVAPSLDQQQLVQAVIFPTDHDPGVIPLYVDADFWTSLPIYRDQKTIDGERGFVHAESERAIIRLSNNGVLSAFDGNHGFRVDAGQQVSFGTYFNAFPAAYWRRWTTLQSIDLRVVTEGAGQIIVYRSNARGVVQKVEARPVSSHSESVFELPFKNFADGGWYWFDLATEDQQLDLVEAGWFAPASVAPTAGRPGTASIAITTLNRGEYCSKLLADIGARADVVSLLDRVYVVDQGSEKIVDAPGFDIARERLGDKLHVIEQANIGGSGGFSRGMYETVQAGVSDSVLVLDDDVAIEPESIRRLVRFSDYLTAPAIVGGHMFDMFDRSKLHAFAEGVNLWPFMWGSRTPDRHDLAESNLRQTRWMHRRLDADYNGWWMSLIPVEVLKKVGLSLPVFIKWDDAEYSLRARDAGYPTVTLPGAAVWHVSWIDKDDSQDWQAFYHARNRLIAALLHSPFTKGGGLARANFALDLKHLLTMQYFAAAARREAYRSVLAGPGALFDELDGRLGRVRELAGKYVDGRAITDLSVLPAVGAAGPEGAHRNTPPRKQLLTWLPRTLVRHYLSPARSSDATPPQAHLAYSDAKWWIVPGYDSVVISNAEGSGVTWHRRDRRAFQQGFWGSVRSARVLRSRWQELSAQYRAALPQLTSVETWGRYFAALAPTSSAAAATDAPSEATAPASGRRSAVSASPDAS